MRAATQQVVAGVAAGCREPGLGPACRRDLELRAVRCNLAKVTAWFTCDVCSNDAPRALARCCTSCKHSSVPEMHQVLRGNCGALYPTPAAGCTLHLHRLT